MSLNLHQIKHFVRHFFTARRNGHGIHSPFAYQLCEEVFYNRHPFYVFNQLNVLRKQILTNHREIEIVDLGAGSKTFKNNKRRISDIAQKGISTKAQSELIFRLLHILKSKTIIELGTSLGLNTLYLASADPQAHVISIEGAPALSLFAKELAGQQKKNNIEFICAHFDTALSAVLEKTKQVDCLYLDGNHTYEATLRYFEMALNYKNESSVFIVDDIYWSEGMTKAWNEIKKNPEVTLSIDAFYFGMLFFKKDIKEKINLKLFLS